MRLRPRLLLAFLAASVLPLLLVAAVVYHSTTRHTERLVGRRLQENALQAADAIDDFMRNRVADMRRFGESPIFGRDTAEIAAELRLNVEAYPFYSELLYVDDGGTILAASDSAAVGTPLLQRHPDLADEVRAALAGPAGLAYIADLADTGGEAPGTSRVNLQLVTRVPSSGASSSRRAVVAVVDLERFSDILAKLDALTPGAGRASLLDSLGNVLLSRDATAPVFSRHPDADSGLLAASRGQDDSETT